MSNRRGRRTLDVCCVLVFLLVANESAAQELPGPRELLKRAKNIELIELELDGAISLYRQLIERYPEYDTEVAEAMFRLGWCLERVGSPEAVRWYQGVLVNYPESAWSSQADTRLRIVAPALSTSASAIREVKVAEFGADVAIPDLSDDASFLTFVNPATGDLAALDLATGQKRYLTFTRGLLPGGSGEHAVASCISPDNQFVAYTWIDRKGECQIRLLRLDDRSDRVLYSNPSSLYLEPGEWSHDGALLYGYAVVADGDTSNIIEISVADGYARVIYQSNFGPQHFGPLMDLQISPDERFLAITQAQDQREYWADVYIIDRFSTSLSQKIRNAAHCYLHDWHPDGTSIIYSSEEAPVPAIHAINITDGRITGESTELFRYSGRIIPTGYSDQGELFYFKRLVKDVSVVDADWHEIPASWIQRWARFHIGELTLDQPVGEIGSLDPLAYSRDGTLLFSARNRESRAVSLEEPMDGTDSPAHQTVLNVNYPIGPAPVRSPAEQYVAYLSPPDVIHWYNAPANLVVRDVQSGESTNVPLSFTPQGGVVAWQDEETVLLPGVDREGVEGIFAVEYRTRVSRLILPMEVAGIHHLQVIPDAEQLLFIDSDYVLETHALIVLEIASGERRVLFQSGEPLGPYAISSTSRQIAIVERITGDTSYRGRCRILLFSSDTGTVRTLTEVPFHQPLEVRWVSPQLISLVMSNYGTGIGRGGDYQSEEWTYSLSDGSMTRSALDIEGVTAYRSGSTGTGPMMVLNSPLKHLELWRLEGPPLTSPPPSIDR
ncbi:hypothetical protein ACFL6R_01805 [Gemmatimonadota bacterium]